MSASSFSQSCIQVKHEKAHISKLFPESSVPSLLTH